MLLDLKHAIVFFSSESTALWYESALIKDATYFTHNPESELPARQTVNWPTSESGQVTLLQN